MSKLRIPLSASSGTRQSTRSRRVLWLGFFWLLVVVTSLFLAKLWFTRDTLTSYAPEDTIISIHLTPSRLAWTKIAKDFGKTPLISGRPLTFNDLTELKVKEFAIFISENNESSLAIRIKERDLPIQMLNSYGITNQKLSKNQWLLSSKPLPFSKNNQTSWHPSQALPGSIGFFVSENFIGRINLSKNGYSIKIPETKPENDYLPVLPKSTLAALVLVNGTELELEKLFKQIDVLLEPLKIIKSLDFYKKLNKNTSTFIIAESENELQNLDFLIETKTNLTTLSQILQTVAAFQNPRLESLDLPDQTKAQEIIVDPQSIIFQSLWINGIESKYTETPTGRIFTMENQGFSYLSSNEALLQDFLLKKTEKETPVCGSKKNLIFLKPQVINKINQVDVFSFSKPDLLEITNVFSEIVVNKEKIQLCY